MIGDMIKNLRTSKNISQNELCKYLEINQSTLSNYEKNRRTPDIYTVCKIADYFGVSVDYLLERY